MEKRPNISFPSSFRYEGKISNETLGQRALKLPPAGVNRNKRRKEYTPMTNVERPFLLRSTTTRGSMRAAGGRFPRQQSYAKSSGCVPLSFRIKKPPPIKSEAAAISARKGTQQADKMTHDFIGIPKFILSASLSCFLSL